MTTAYQSVVFDCDSTLVTIEGIEELAGDHLDHVRALTEAAMEGAVPLDEVYGRRLEMIRPGRTRVAELGDLYIRTLVGDARETIEALLWLGKTVRIVSGGLHPPVAALAEALGLSSADVAAVGIDWSASGEYAGFDERSPLARSGGKEEAIHAWDLPRPTLLVGDGATDLEARPAVDGFVAFAGVAYRPAVAAGADAVIRAQSLAPVLVLATGEAERSSLRNSRWAELFARGESLLSTSEDAGEPPATAVARAAGSRSR